MGHIKPIAQNLRLWYDNEAVSYRLSVKTSGEKVFGFAAGSPVPGQVNQRLYSPNPLKRVETAHP